MRRAPIVIATTIAGTVGVLTFEPRKPSFATLSTASASTSPSASSSAGSGSSSSGSGSGSSSGSSGSQATTPSSSGSADSTAAKKTSTAAKTATGDSIATQYGPVQVKVTVKAGKITNVVPLALTGSDPKSAQISALAAPALLQSALAKQTAAIDTVSGATITSAAYEASLQSALDQLGFKAADGSRGSSTIPQVEEHGGFGGFGH